MRSFATDTRSFFDGGWMDIMMLPMRTCWLLLVCLLPSSLLLSATTAFTPGYRWKLKPAFSSSRGLDTSPFNEDDFADLGDVTRTVVVVDPTTTTSSVSSLRSISEVEKFSRLPFWPAWNGVAIFLISKLLGDDLGAQIEDWVGGRVCPNFFRAERRSPFIMLVHHRHSFAPWDPFRFLQQTFFPEGFPAHPHRGFVTVTYFLKGGFLHRDSVGVKQIYGAEDRHQGKHTQWLNTGAGLLHEEMFDIKPDKGGIPFLQPSSQELFQLWLNLPSYSKMNMPYTQLLGGGDGPDDDSTPRVVTDSTETLVLAGAYQEAVSAAPIVSSVAIFHVTMNKGSMWRHELPESHRTAILYLRTGSVSINQVVIPVHHTAYLTSTGTTLLVESEQGADFIFLADEPLNEPVAAQGSMVLNTPDQINLAYSDYQAGKMGVPWDHKLTDEEWRAHVEKYPSIYKE